MIAADGVVLRVVELQSRNAETGHLSEVAGFEAGLISGTTDVADDLPL